MLPFAFAIALLVDGTPPPPSPVAPAPVVVAAPAPAPIPTIIAPAVTVTRPQVAPTAGGHYTCAGGQTDQFNTACTADVTANPGPNPGSTVPEETVAWSDPAYAQNLIAQLCEIKPVFCGGDE